jgi:Ca2+/Na+ antiporter
MGVLKGRYGISAGNIIGSDIFNLLGVLGLAGMLHPVEVDPMSRVSLAALSGMVYCPDFHAKRMAIIATRGTRAGHHRSR